jgi:hypothetical protein
MLAYIDGVVTVRIKKHFCCLKANMIPVIIVMLPFCILHLLLNMNVTHCAEIWSAPVLTKLASPLVVIQKKQLPLFWKQEQPCF